MSSTESCRIALLYSAGSVLAPYENTEDIEREDQNNNKEKS